MLRDQDSPVTRRRAFSSLAGSLLIGCSRFDVKPSIEFTRIPPADQGGPEIVDTIEGRVKGAQPGDRLVLFARSEGWWVQPEPERPYTILNSDSTWRSPTHLGTEYAAALVKPDYRPPHRADDLPHEGGNVIVVAKVPGDSSKRAVRTLVRFAGYEWTVRASSSDRGGKNDYDISNVWTDQAGALHLRIANVPNDPGKWTCAQVLLKRSLGYGTYRFVVRDISQLDPAAVLALYVWDAAKAADQSPREWDIEFSRWSDPASKNSRYVIQPSHVRDHVVRFESPAGTLSHSIRWEPGKAAFRTVRGSSPNGRLLYEHTFTSGVPLPANEKLRLNFYDFQRGSKPLEKPAEVVIDHFEFLP